MKVKVLIAGVATSLLGSLALPLVAHAASTVVVTPGNTQGWSTADTRTNGHVSFVNDASAPLGNGALSLKTDAAPAASQDKAQYMHAASTPIADVTELGYSAKQNAASFADGTASYQLAVNVSGTTGFTTFVYEPYENGNTMVNGAWQTYDVDAGQFWSSRTVSDGGTCNLTAGGGGAPFYTLAQIKANCPNAVVVGYGVNVGSNNPGYDIETDAFVFNGTTYDFELEVFSGPTSKDSCKNDGWKDFTTPSFKNQGQCVSYVETEFKRTKTYQLDSAEQNGVNVPTTAGTWYKVTVSGTWTNRPGEVVDAECTNMQSGTWMNAVNGGIYSPDLLDVQVENAFVNWGACDSTTHTYTRWVKATDSSMNLRVFDGDTNTNQQIAGWFGDNVGTLGVKVVAYTN
jgi:hypothetical protein